MPNRVYSIGVVAGIPQPVVVNARLRNVPDRGTYNWEPGAHLGIHRMDTFWFAPEGEGPAQGSRGDAVIRYLARRILVMIPTLAVISALVFIIIQLPEGDFLTSQIAELEAQGETVNRQKIEFLRQEYGLDRPPVERYLRWNRGNAAGRLRLLLRAPPAGQRSGGRPAVPHLSDLVRDHRLHLAGVVPDRGCTRPPTSTASATTPLPFSVSSGSRPRTSCSPSCSCTSRTCTSGRRSAVSWTPNTSASP